MSGVGGALASSLSLNNLLLHEKDRDDDDNDDDDDEDEEEACTIFRDGPIKTKSSQLHRNKPRTYNTILRKPPLRSTRSTNDVRISSGGHKIALTTTTDPHVNNIVISEGPKDEKDAVSRLEQLSLMTSSVAHESGKNLKDTVKSTSSVTRVDKLTNASQVCNSS